MRLSTRIDRLERDTIPAVKIGSLTDEQLNGLIVDGLGRLAESEPGETWVRVAMKRMEGLARCDVSPALRRSIRAGVQRSAELSDADVTLRVKGLAEKLANHVEAKGTT